MLTATPTHNPYKTWLNISVDRRPLNAYQLLGLEPLETNRQRIEAAAARQRSNLDIARATAEAEQWERISQELDAAIATLSDLQQKAVLDAALRRQMASGGFIVSKSSKPAESLAPSAEADSPTIQEQKGGVKCGHCGKQNLADRKFCADCGQPMWEPCPNCQTMCPGAERFCGACGVDIPRFVQERTDELQQKIDAAQKLQSNFQFEVAAAALREVAKVDDPRFDKVARVATELLGEFSAQRRRQEGAATVAVESAQQFAAANQHDKVIAALSKIPAALLSSSAAKLLASSTATWEEVSSLNRELRAALESNRLIEALAKIERLLLLKPDNDQVRQVGLQIGRRLTNGAKKLLKEHRFDDAQKLLRQIPSFAQADEFEVVQETVSELSWLWNEIKTAPLINKTLVSLAERLVKLTPDHAPAKQAFEQLRTAAQVTVSPPWLLGPYRPGIAKTKSAGIAVDGLATLRTLSMPSATGAPLLAEKPGRFFVACGLALQALGKARIDINLAPEQKKKLLLGGLSFGFRKKAETVAWGLDLGSSALKAAKLVLDEKGETVRVEAVELIEFPASSNLDDADLEAANAADAALQMFLTKHALQPTDRVAVNLPGLRVLGRTLITPPIEHKKLAALVEYEAKQQIPYSLEDLEWDFAATDPVDEKSKDKFARRVLLVASKKNHVRGRLATFERAKIKVDLLQSDCVALHNFFQFDHPQTDSPQTTALLDIGGDTANVVISGADALWFRTVSVGGVEFSKPLLKKFGLTLEQAELWKKEPARIPRLHQAYASFEPLFAQIIAEIQRSLASFRVVFPEVPVTQLLGVGGGFQLHGLLAALKSAGVS